MCKFFSFVSDGNGKIYYFNWQQRLEIMAGKIKVQSADSHTSIADFYGFKGEQEDKLNKYEYNPLTKIFTVDQINTTDDSKHIEKIINDWDFKTIIEPLIIKPIINPFKDKKTKNVTKHDIKLLKEWASVMDSVIDSVWDSMIASVMASVRASVMDSVTDSVIDSVMDSVMASVWAYMSSFFDIKYKFDFSSNIKLWEKGLVPSFDGKIWRLHGEGGKILYEMKSKKE